mgnify:CR=1 FL=1
MGFHTPPNIIRTFKFIYTAFHIWTVIIAFEESGTFAGIATLVLPILGEIYWFFAMMGENWLYVIVSIIVNIISLLLYAIHDSESVPRG